MKNSAIKDFYEQNPYPNYMLEIHPSEYYTELPYENILIVGCGTNQANNIAYSMREKPVRITAMDLSATSIAVSKLTSKAANLDNITYVVGDICEPVLNFEQPFEAIFCDCVLHHIPDARVAVENMFEVLDDSGLLYGSVYSDKRPEYIRELSEKFTSEGFSKEDVKKYLEENPNEFYTTYSSECDLSDTWLHPYYKHYSPKELENLLHPYFELIAYAYAGTLDDRIIFTARKRID